MATPPEFIIEDLTEFEVGWIRGWLTRNGVAGVPTDEQVREALWALQAYMETMTPDASQRIQ
jgi:hypothetical protein